MKKLIAAVLTMAPFFALAQEGTYTVQGKVGSYSAPAKMYLVYYVQDQQMTDSITLKDGQFQFKGTVGNEPRNAYLVLNEKGDGLKFKDYKPFYIEKGDIKISGDDKIAKAKVDGPKTNQDNLRYVALTKPIDDEQDAHDATEKAETDEQKNSESISA